MKPYLLFLTYSPEKTTGPKLAELIMNVTGDAPTPFFANGQNAICFAAMSNSGAWQLREALLDARKGITSLTVIQSGRDWAGDQTTQYSAWLTRHLGSSSFRPPVDG